MHNSFDRNAYHVTDVSQARFAWDNATWSFAELQARGPEAQGTIDTGVAARSWSCDMPTPW